MNDYKFGNFLYELRISKGLSQAQLGAMLGVSNKAVSKWESGAAKPQTATLFALAKILEVTAEELLAGERKEQGSVPAPTATPAPISTPQPAPPYSPHLALLRQKYRRTKRAARIVGWSLVGVFLQIFFVTGFLVGLGASETVGGLYAGLTVLALLVLLIAWIALRVSSASQKRLLQRMGEDVTEWKEPTVAKASKSEATLTVPPSPTPQEPHPCEPIRAYQRALCDRVRIGLVLYAVPVWLTVILVTFSELPTAQLFLWLYLTVVYLPLMLLFSVAAIVWTVVAIILTQRRKKQLSLQYPNEWKATAASPKDTRAWRLDVAMGAWGAFGLLSLLMQSSMGIFLLGALFFTLAWVYFFIRFTKMRP